MRQEPKRLGQFSRPLHDVGASAHMHGQFCIIVCLPVSAHRYSLHNCICINNHSHLQLRLAGLRPTLGRISRYGVMALSWTQDRLGPMCRYAEDCAMVMGAIAKDDGELQFVRKISR